MNQAILDRIEYQKAVLYGDSYNQRSSQYSENVKEHLHDPFAENYNEYVYDLENIEQDNDLDDLPEPIIIPVVSPDIDIELEDNNEVNNEDYQFCEYSEDQTVDDKQIQEVISKQKGYQTDELESCTSQPSQPTTQPAIIENKPLDTSFRLILTDIDTLTTNQSPDDYTLNQKNITSHIALHSLISNTKHLNLIDDVLNLPVSRPK